MKRSLLWFLLGSVGLWLVTAYPAWLLQEEQGLCQTGLALFLCLLPMVGTLIWSSCVADASPESQLAAMMGGTGLRLVFVGIAGVVLHQTVPALRHDSFLLWVVFFYLATLALEIALLAVPRRKV